MVTYELPDQAGKIHVLHGTESANTKANEVFMLYQKEASEGSLFKRHPLKTHLLRGRFLVNYFSHNAGVPYKYIAGDGESVPFDKAPSSVVGALRLIEEHTATLFPKESINFNEILSVAYLEKQKMSYHTDNEKGLGPIIASLSLGSTALMHFRLRNPTTSKKHHPKSLTLVLNHGDIVIMEGHMIQFLYEHSVIPLGFRIAATARSINLQKNVTFIHE